MTAAAALAEPEAPPPADAEVGPTFAIEDIGWIDFETRAPVSVKDVGAYAYARQAWPIMFGFAIGEGPAELIETGDLNVSLTWEDMPPEIHEFHKRVERAETVWCAHNAAFDRCIWNAAPGFPRMEPWMIIDSAVQAGCSGLPAGLDAAATRAGTLRKTAAGTSLINMFSMIGSKDITIEANAEAWHDFGTYCMNDIEAMRDLFRTTLQLPLREWEEYWAAENVNERGVMIDLPMCRNAVVLAEADRKVCDDALWRITDQHVGAVTQVQRLAVWLDANLDPGGRDLLTAEIEERDEETDEILKPAKFSLRRERIDLLLAYLADKNEPGLIACREALEIRRFGGSTTPAKFTRMLAQNVDGQLFGQYVFSGASQTGRFSSRGGPQLHNLMRTALDYELDAVDAVTRGCTHADLAALGDDPTPVARKLSMLIRPALVARPGRAFVWSDLKQIEARVLPWLAQSKGAEKRLEYFRRVDRDPTLPDLYTVSAAEMFHVTVEEVEADKKAAETQGLRQRGKVAELALGFGGGPNALQKMAANYGIRFEDELAKDIVKRWREANPWAALFWGKHNSMETYGLWGAFNSALEQPGVTFFAGRVSYVCLPYLGRNAIFCVLPSGRALCYRNVRIRREEIVDDAGVVTGVETNLVFDRGFGTQKLWHGILAENITQAVAADVLRGTIVRLEEDPAIEWMPLVLHTHDELVIEPLERDVGRARAILAGFMRAGFKWSQGLPLASDETCCFHYSKSESETVIWH